MRKTFVKVHLWLGVSIGLLWALQGLSGSLLVFHREFDRFNGPAVTAGPMASLDLIAQRSSAASDGRIERIAIIDRAGDLLTADYHDPEGEARSLLVDAATADIVGRRDLEPLSPASGSFSQWLYLLHQSMLRGEESNQLTGLSGFALLAAIIAGLFIAWPRRGAWRATFNWRRWRSVDQRLYGWHRALGLAVGFILLVTVPCGLYLVFAGDFRPALARIVPHRLPYRAAPLETLPADLVGPQAALDVAESHFPGAAFVSIAMPTERSPIYAVRLRQEAEPRLWAGVTNIAVDAASGRTLDVYDPTTAPVSNRIADLAFAIHNGEVGGLAGRSLILLLGLSLPTLYGLGLWAWWRKRRRRKKRG